MTRRIRRRDGMSETKIPPWSIFPGQVQPRCSRLASDGEWIHLGIEVYRERLVRQK